VKLITPECLGVPKAAGIVNLVASTSNGHDLIDLNSSNVDAFLLFDQSEGELDPDVLEWLEAQKKETVSYEATWRFQESWSAKLLWAECVKGEDGLYNFVRCLICSEFERKEKIFQPKFDMLKKHGGKRKAKVGIPSKSIRKY
jgi:hypothetical protein